MQEKELLEQWIAQSRKIVFFGGAGVSTESNIPDFRSAQGLYHQQQAISPEEILSHSFFRAHTEEFYRFYREKMLYPHALPNAAHRRIAALEKEGKLSAVVTQNIDGLHQKAGSRTVYELHGSVERNYCMHCHKAYPLEYILSTKGVPQCSCGGIIKPDVVLYEESLSTPVLQGAIEAIAGADMLIIGGTSLSVYPAAGLVRYYRGNRLVIINKTPTPYDESADLLIQGSLGEVLG